MKVWLVGLSVLFGSSVAVAKPVFNKTASFTTPILITVFTDSEDSTKFYYVPDSYTYCGLESKKPEFRFQAFEGDEIPYFSGRFNLCGTHAPDTLSAARDDLKLQNSNAVLLPVPPVTTWTKSLPSSLPVEHPIDFKCSLLEASGTEQRFECLILGSGKRTVRDAKQLFTGFEGLIAAGYFERIVEGVEFDNESKSYTPKTKTFPIAYLISGMQSYPETWSKP